MRIPLISSSFEKFDNLFKRNLLKIVVKVHMSRTRNNL